MSKRIFLTLISLFLGFYLLLPQSLYSQPQEGATVPQGASEIKRQQETILSTLRRAFEKKYSAKTLAALEHCRRGLQAYFDEDFPRALRELSDPSIHKNTALGDFAYFYLGAIHQQNDALLESKAAYERLALSYPDSALLLSAQMQLVKCERDLGNYRAALLALQPLVVLNKPAALLMAAECYDLLGDPEAAGKFYQRLYYEFPTTSEATIAEKRLDAAGYMEKNPPAYQTLIKRVDGFITAGQYRQALRELDEVTPKGLARTSKDEIGLKRGICYYNIGQYNYALSWLRRVPATDAKAHAEALYYIFQIQRKLRTPEEMAAVARTLQQRYPQNKFTESTLYLLAASYELKKQPELAQELYQFIVDNFSTDPYSERAHWKLAWQIYLSKDYEAAIARLSDHIRKFPESDNLAALFWTGRAYEKLEQPQKALYIYRALVASFPNGFYGLLAKKRLAHARGRGETNGFPEIDEILALIKPKVSSTKLDGAVLEAHLEKFRQLSTINLSYLAFKQLQFITGSDPVQLDFLNPPARSTVDHLRWIQVLNKLLPNYHSYEHSQLPTEIWKLLFPLENWKKIKLEAAKYDIDPHLISALIRQESTFDARALSHAKAMGMMQILPSTGRLIARSLRQKKFTAKKLYDANINITFGVYHFANLVKRYGQVELALAAYNAGSGRVEGWRNQFSTEDIHEWVESIPITETRNYVKNIMCLTDHYRKIYTSQ